MPTVILYDAHSKIQNLRPNIEVGKWFQVIIAREIMVALYLYGHYFATIFLQRWRKGYSGNRLSFLFCYSMSFAILDFTVGKDGNIYKKGLP
jgi:hypothetical protein